MPPFDSSDNRTSVPAGVRPKWQRFDLRRLRPAELFDAWLFAETDATLALAAWRSAGRADRRHAHVAYVAALDREARAAAVLEQRLRFAR